MLVSSHNIESQILSRRAQQSHNIIERLFFALQATKMESFERRAFRNAKAVTAVTVQDKELVQSWGVREVTLVENGVDPEYYDTSTSVDELQLLFLASLDWYPNLDALDDLLEDIMPVVHSRQPGARLR